VACCAQCVRRFPQLRKNASQEIGFDWRCSVAASLAEDYRDPDSKRLYPKGSVVTRDTLVRHGTRTLAFADPSAVALFLSQSQKSFVRAMEIHPFHPERLSPSRPKLDTILYDYLELIMIAVISAYTAIEAFANDEIPEDFLYQQRRKTGSGWHEIRPGLRGM